MLHGAAFWRRLRKRMNLLRQEAQGCSGREDAAEVLGTLVTLIRVFVSQACARVTQQLMYFNYANFTDANYTPMKILNNTTE